MATEFRNPIYNIRGTVDCEINHPVFGWIPFTATPDDPEQNGQDIYAAIIAAGDIAAYVAPTPVVPDRVSSRQFGLQMIAAGIKDEVDTWIATQDAATQWAYERSATFLRTDDMMQTGFTALGFTSAQIDAFFTAAALL